MKKLLLTLAIICVMLSSCWAKPWTTEMNTLATKTEQQFNLPHGLCRAFATVESSCDTIATRIETGYFNIGSKYAANITRDATAYCNTFHCLDLIIEREQRSTSFGLFQCMGENLRSMGYNNPIIQPTMQEQFYYFGKFVSKEWNKTKNIKMLASFYNSGTIKNNNKHYATLVYAQYKKFQNQ